MTHVDFSMHLGDKELEGLCSEVASTVGARSFRFQDAVGECVAGDKASPWAEREWSADIMSSAWVDLFAAIAGDQVLELARRWLGSFGTGLTPEGAPHVPEAIQALADLCRKAKERQVSVVFSWSA